MAAQDLTVNCDGQGNTTALSQWLSSNGGASASDICSGVSWTNDYSGLSDGCGATGTARVTFTATDSCGNNTSTTATFTIIDTIAPRYRDWETDRKSTRLNSSHRSLSRMPSSA